MYTQTLSFFLSNLCFSMPLSLTNLSPLHAHFPQSVECARDTSQVSDVTHPTLIAQDSIWAQEDLAHNFTPSLKTPPWMKRIPRSFFDSSTKVFLIEIT